MVSGILASALPAFAAIDDASMVRFNADVFNFANGVLTAQGWAGANYPANNLGYRIDGGEPELDGVEFASIHPAEADAIHQLAGENAFRFKTRGDGIALDLQPGEHTITLVVRVTNGTDTAILDMGSQTFTVTGVAEPAKLTLMSFNTIWVDGTQICDVGDALTFCPITDPQSSIGLRGWAYIGNSTIESMGYKIDDGDPVVSASYIQDRADVRAALGGVSADYANGFNVSPIDVSGLTEGDHTVTVVVKAADGTYVPVVNVPVKITGSSGPVEPDPAALVSMSFNTVWVDGTQICDTGDAGAFIKNNPIVDAASIGLRGWAWISNSTIEAMGYRIDDGEPVVDAGWIQQRADVQAALGGLSADVCNGFNVSPIDVSGLTAGEHTVTVVVKAADGTYVDVVAVPITVSHKLVGQSLDYWAHFHAGADCAAAAVFDVDQYDGFHTYGWVGFDAPVARIGYRLNGTNVFPDTVAITDGEEGVKAAGGQYAVRYDMIGSFEGAVVGANELVWIAELEDGAIVDFFGPYSFTCTEVGGTVHPNSTLFADAVLDGNVHGWWTGPLVTGATGGTINFTFNAPWAFNGICYMMYASEATVDVKLFNEYGIQIDGAQDTYAADGVPTVYFTRAHAPGVYTIQFEMVSGNYFVFASGTPSSIPVEVSMNGFIPNGATLQAPVAFLTGANNPGQPVAPKNLNAAFDDLHFDATVLCDSKAYLWVADPANQDALSFEKTSVEEIYLRGWSYIDKPIYTFGYRIDGGDIVYDDAFIDERSAELSGAGFPGAQGFAVTVPVGSLSSGEHTIEVIVIDEDGMFTPVVKTKSGVDYPVGVTFTVTKLQDHESVVTGKSFDKYYVEGVELGQGAAAGYLGNVDRNIINKYPQAYALTGSDEITITGWATFDGEHVETFGYKIDDQPSVTSPDFIVNRNAELAGAGFPYGQGFSITFSYAGLEPGEHTVTLFATALDEAEHEIFSYNFTVSEVGAWLYDTTQPITIDGQGWWTGENLSIADGNVCIEFESPISFDGIYTIYWANNMPGAVMDVSIYDENDDLLDTVTVAFIFNGKLAYKFNKVFAPGAYTIEYAFTESQASHFVLGAGQQGDIETVVYGNCNNSGNATWSAPSVGLLYAELPPEPTTCNNAAFDELKYDDTALVSSKAYTWVADPANREAMNFEEGAVSNIYFKGWAQLSTAITGFGYVIDGGEPVVDAAFIVDRSAELESAGYPGAQGFGVTVPVADLAAGEHTIKIVAIDANGDPVDIVKVKNDTDYPVAITFTVSEGTPIEVVDPDAKYSLDRVYVNQNTLGAGAATATEYTINPGDKMYILGWAVNASGLDKIVYTVNGGENIECTGSFRDRPDVAAAFQLDASAGVGAGFGLDNDMMLMTGIENLEPGTYEIALKAVYKDGKVKIFDAAASGMGVFTLTVEAPQSPAQLIKATFDLFDLNNGALTVQGWAGANFPANNLGYKIDDGEVILDGIEFANFNTPAEGDTIKNLAGPDAFRFKTRDGALPLGLEAGEHTITIVMRVNDGTQNYIVEMGSKTFTVTGQPDPAKLTLMSFNTIWVDGEQICDVGDALTFCPIEGKPSAIGLRGWAYITNSTIEAMGYRIDDGEPVVDAAFIQDRADVRAALGGVSADVANGFMVSPIDVSGLANGEHTITIVVKAADGNYVDVVEVPVVIRSEIDMQEFNWYALDGVVLSSAGNVDALVQENHPTYLLGNYNEIGFLGKVALAGNEPISGFGYSVDGGDIVTKEVFFSRIFNAGFDYTAELTAAGYPNGEGFWIVMNYNDLEPGDHTLTYYVLASDGTPIEMMSYDFTVAEVVWLYNKGTGYTTGFWTGPNCGRPTGNICIEFTTEEAFNGVYQIFYADFADCLVDINLYDEDETLLETIPAHFYDNSRSIEYFENVYPAGSYILEYQYVGEVGHFVLGSGNASDVEVAMYGDYGTNENTFAAPTVALMIAEYVEPVEAACTNAAFDDLYYDEVKLCEAKAYKWVVDNADKLDYEEGTVSQIYFRGWAQLNVALAGFGYIIDDGEVVSDPSFIQDRAAELEGAGFAGAQGYAIWVPVEDLAAGEHTIKIVAISEDGDIVDIFKLKDGVEYPVAITFTITEVSEESSDEPDDSSEEPDDSSEEPDDSSTEEPHGDPYDVNGDGETNNKDVVTLFRFVSGENEYDAKYDLDGDGENNNKDVVLLFRSVSEK